MLLDIQVMRPDDYVGFTFFIGYMAMFAASVFFFFERGSVDDKWKLSLLISGLIGFGFTIGSLIISKVKCLEKDQALICLLSH